MAPERLHRPKRGRSGPCRRCCRSRGGGDGSHAWCHRQARGATSSAREGERRGLNVACRDSFVTRASAPSTAHDRSIDRSVRLSTTKEDIRVCGRIGRIGLVHATYQRSTLTRSGTTLDPGIESDASRRYIQISAFARCFRGGGWGGGGNNELAPPLRRRRGGSSSRGGLGVAVHPRATAPPSGGRSPVAGRGSTVFFKKS